MTFLAFLICSSMLVGWMPQQVAAGEGSFGFVFKPWDDADGAECKVDEERAIWQIAEIVGVEYGYPRASDAEKWLLLPDKQLEWEKLERDNDQVVGNGTGGGRGGNRHLQEEREENNRELGHKCNACDWWLSATQNSDEYGDCCKCCASGRRSLRMTRQLQTDMEKRAAALCEEAALTCVICHSVEIREF